MKFALNLALAFCSVVTFTGFVSAWFGCDFTTSLVCGMAIAGFVAPQI